MSTLTNRLRPIRSVALGATAVAIALVLVPSPDARASASPASAAPTGSVASCRGGATHAFPSQNAFGVTAGPGGTWFSEAASVDRVRGDRVRRFPVPDPATAGVGWLTWPGHGPLWFADRGNGRLGTITATGTVHEYQIPAGPAGAAIPQAIVLGPGHQVWFTEPANNRIGELNTHTNSFTFTAIPTPDAGLVGMVRDHDGDLYAVERSADKVARLDPRTGLFTEWTLPVGAFPNRLAVDTRGNVWFTELDTNQLGRIGPDGHLSELPLPGGPVGLTFNDGQLYAALFVQGAVAQISTRGTILHAWTLPHAANAGPLQIAVSHGYIWTTGNNDVYRINLACH